MNSETATPAGKPAEDSYDFSLVLGGPLYQLFRRARLSDNALELLQRRIVFIALIAWLPLLMLSALEGNAWGGGVVMPFLYDADVHVRFLIALPVLVLAELVVHQRMRPIVRQFLERDLIGDAERGKVDAALASAYRLRNSVVAEVAMIAIVYGIGVLVIWRTYFTVPVPSWYGVFADGLFQPSLAGWWFGVVSLPLWQFILLRWYFRLFVWARFLWHLSRINLQLVPTHPDRCGGLGFLSEVCTAFAPFLLAQGAVLAGSIANQIFHVGAKLPQFKIEIIALVAVMQFAVFGPLLVFIPVLARAKRIGLREYGALAQRNVREFDDKWLRGKSPEGEVVAGFSASYDIVKAMRIVPFTRPAIFQLAVLTLLPLLPLTLTMISFEELLDRTLKIIF
jgi:hypothetical protein